MIISRIEVDDCTYFNLHAEQAFEGTYGSFLSNDIPQAGIYQNTLTKTTIDKIICEIKDFPITTKYILIDFNGIEYIQVNQNFSIREGIIDYLNSFIIYLSNIKEDLIKDLGFESEVENVGNKCQDIILNNGDEKKVITSSNQAFEKIFHNKLTRDYIIEGTKFHHSSSVFINMFIDLKKFISNDQKFFIYTIYKLALSMTTISANRDWVINKGEKEIVLFAQNMNSSFIASVLTNFIQLDVILVDHVGPINKIYSSFNNLVIRDKKYLVVSDMICLGSEVRIAKNIIEFSGGEYLGNVSIVRVNTMKEENKYRNVETIYLIEKGNNKIGYQIKTALDL